MRIHPSGLSLLFVSTLGLFCPVGLADDKPIDFGRDILPLLSNNCFQCHGPDEAIREAGLRLDDQTSVFGELESGATAVVPKDLASSAIMQRITSDDESVKMPPTDSGKELSDADIAKIKLWIEQGAVWGKHWAFVTPEATPQPVPIKGTTAVNPIDLFIQSQLKPLNLTQESEADRATLIRRVSLDVTGLPPTVAEIDLFLNDKEPGAYERMVDRFLSSTHYGEHMARIWLDAARYGDTHGLHLDNERSIWPYRDWVIQSFNENKPFDQFTIEQLAGDLLPEPSMKQRVATGFNRCNVTTSEGGSIDEEYYVRYAVDRVETTATVWLGLTAGCAVCHDHKFDPLTQREFYQMFSYFFSLTERAMDGNALLPPPSLKVPTAEQVAQKGRLGKELAAAAQAIEAGFTNIAYVDPQAEVALGELTQNEQVWIEDALPEGAQPAGDGPVIWDFVTAPDAPVFSGEKSTVRTATGLSQHFFTGAKQKLAIGENDLLFAYVFLDAENPPETVQLQFNDGTWEHRAFWGADKAHGAGRKNATNLPMGALPETGKWIRLEVAAADVGLKPGAELNGWAFTQFGGTVHWDRGGIVNTSLSDEQRRSQYAWEQFRQKVKAPMLPAEIQKALDVEVVKRNDAQKKQITRYYLENVNPDTKAVVAPLKKNHADINRKLTEVDKGIPATLVMQDRPEKRMAHILVRGQYEQKGEAVDSSVPQWILPTASSESPQNRLGLAQWLVDPKHPLTSRVTVNRMWQHFFGIGIVRTSEDFGVQGERPTHPELLDWLALRFIESDWDVKAFQKMLMMSATYRQSSRVTEAKLAADPENRYLSRGARFRMDAEVIRDQALSVSGLLVPTIGGKSVKPYQPDGLWKPVGFGGSNTSVFKQDHGDALYRRSLYTFWKRTVPPPSMSTFDAPNRETCQVRRARTNTPLQALVLMNDVQFVEAARKFAERTMLEGGDDDTAKIVWAFRSVTARQPSESELAVFNSVLTTYRQEFGQKRDAAESLLKVGESPRNEELDVAEVASWTMVTHLILNLSEIVTKG
jgi:hypothetical protein